MTTTRRARRGRLLHSLTAVVVATALAAAMVVSGGQATWGTPGTRGAGPAAAVTTSKDAAWIVSAQLPDGAIASYPDRTWVEPYLGHLATVGLARAAARTRDQRFITAAWRWLNWRNAHINAQGWVDDHTIVNGVPVTVNDVNAADSEAALYLVALYETWRTSGDRAALDAVAPSVVQAVGVIEGLQGGDGLTIAKPTWPVKYLMNQAEVYAGLRSATLLARTLGDQTLANEAEASAARVRAAVQVLWNPSTGAYDWVVHPNGTRVAVDWRQLYPDALEQAWAVAFGLVDAARSRQIMDEFVQYHPDWAVPTATNLVEGEERPVDFWPVVGWALLAVGRREQALAGAASIRAGADTLHWAWPLSTDEVGELIVLDSGSRPYGIR